MVACTTGASVAAIQLLVNQPIIGSNKFMQQNSSCAIVDQLKQRLQLVIKNTNKNGVAEIISELEGLALTKEVLEITRIGLIVNEIRKQIAQTWPDLSKKCRSLIKLWQKIADLQRPLSSCASSSQSGTPSLMSPNMKRGLTPHATKNEKRAVSNNLEKCLTKNGVLLNNGNYAPCKKNLISPNNTQIPKLEAANESQCSLFITNTTENNLKNLSPDLLLSVNNNTTNFYGTEKRKALDYASATAIKRPKYSQNSTYTSPSLTIDLSSPLISGTANTSSSVSIIAARKDVTSTAELVAQLTGNLPQNMAFDLKKNLKNLNSTTSQQINLNTSLNSNNEFSLSHLDDMATVSKTVNHKTKRKYIKRATRSFQSLSVENDNENNDNFFNETVVKESNENEKNDQEKKTDEQFNYVKTSRFSSFWDNELPKISDLQISVPKTSLNKPIESKQDSVVIKFPERYILFLPYCDTGNPDFLDYDYPEANRFYSNYKRV